MTQSQTTSNARLTILRNSVVVSMALASALPVFVLVAVGVALQETALPNLILLTLTALFVGGVFGVGVYVASFRQIERTLIDRKSVV